MAGLNRCLRDLFIGVNIVFEIMAGLMVALAIWLQILFQSNSQDESDASSLAPLWIQAAGISVVATFGIYGVIKSKKWPLIVYITASVIGVAIFLIRGGIWARVAAQMTLYTGSDRPFSQGLNIAVIIMLAINFVPATVGLGGIFLAAIIVHQLQEQRSVTLDAEGQPPECSHLSPIGSKCV